MINIQFNTVAHKDTELNVIIQYPTVQEALDAYHGVINGLSRRQDKNIEYLKPVEASKPIPLTSAPVTAKRRNTKELKELLCQIVTQADLFRLIFPDVKHLSPDGVMSFLGFSDLENAEIKRVKNAYETITAAINAFTSNNPDAAEFVKAFTAFNTAEDVEALDRVKNGTRWSLLKANDCFIEELKTLYESKKNLFEVANLCKQ